MGAFGVVIGPDSVGRDAFERGCDNPNAVLLAIADEESHIVEFSHDVQRYAKCATLGTAQVGDTWILPFKYGPFDTEAFDMPNWH